MFARVLLGCVALCAPAFVSLAEEPKDKKEPNVTKLKPTLVLRGSHSAVKKEKYAVVTNGVEWNALWKEHCGDDRTRLFSDSEQRVEPDFETHYVLAVFSGGDCGLFAETFTRGDAVLLRFTALGYQTEGRIDDTQTDVQKAKQATIADYCFVVIPKPVKTVVIEEGNRRDLMTPLEWKERKRFPAPKGNK